MIPIIRDKFRVMKNDTERRYARQLEVLKDAGNIYEWHYELWRFKISGEGVKAAWFCPDFVLVYPSQFVIHEIKGYWREAARLRMKAAAGLHPYMKWVGVQWKQKQWVYEEFN